MGKIISLCVILILSSIKRAPQCVISPKYMLENLSVNKCNNVDVWLSKQILLNEIQAYNHHLLPFHKTENGKGGDGNDSLHKFSHTVDHKISISKDIRSRP